MAEEKAGLQAALICRALTQTGKTKAITRSVLVVPGVVALVPTRMAQGLSGSDDSRP